MSLRFYPRTSYRPSFTGPLEEFLATIDAAIEEVDGGFRVIHRGLTSSRVCVSQDGAFADAFSAIWDVYPEGPEKIFSQNGQLIKPRSFADFFASCHGKKTRIGYLPYKGLYFGFGNQSRKYETPEAVFNAYFLEKGFMVRDVPEPKEEASKEEASKEEASKEEASKEEASKEEA